MLICDKFMVFRPMKYRNRDWEFVDAGGSSGHANKTERYGERSPRDRKMIRSRSDLGLAQTKLDADR